MNLRVVEPALIILAGVFLAGWVRGATYYVAPTGLDTNPGSASQPWLTVQKAANTLVAGDTVYVHTGVYAKVTVNVSGSSGSPVTFASYPGDAPVIDATGVTPPSGDTGLFLISNQHDVTIQGFELRNYATTNINLVPAGVFVAGSCQNISILNCNIHDIDNTGGTTANSGNGFGIAIYGRTATPSSGIVISGNNVHNLMTGASESVTLNGNVTNFQVTGNTVHDNNNIGIDFIGFEGTSSDATQDQARSGVCQNNVVYNISSQNNQAYKNGDYSADGLYIDGGTNIVMQRNTVYANDIGVELASEHAGKVTSAITLRDNFVYNNRQTGLFLGGYASSGTGGTSNCTITNNSFFNNDTLQEDNGEAQLRFRTSNCAINQNIFYCDAQNLLISVPVAAANNVGNSLDYNLYYCAAGNGAAQWIWNKTTETGFAAWKSVSGQDVHSLFANPLFVSTTPPDLHLTSTSPAIDAGNPSFVPGTDETDFDGNPRLAGVRVDIGADEYGSSNATTTTDTPAMPTWGLILLATLLMVAANGKAFGSSRLVRQSPRPAGVTDRRR